MAEIDHNIIFRDNLGQKTIKIYKIVFYVFTVNLRKFTAILFLR